MSKVILILILVIIIAIGAFVFGRQSATEPETQVITSQVILERIQEQQFLVTKTLLADEQVTITLSDSSGWQGFFVGDELQAQGTVRVDVGVDLQGLGAEDIVVDHERQEVVLFLPKASILDSSLTGELAVENKRGLFVSLRELFSGDEGADYNRAQAELTRLAELAAQEQTGLFSDARDSARQIIELIVTNVAPGYSIEIQ